MRAARSAPRSPVAQPSVVTFRPPLADGATTTVHVAAFPLARVSARVVRLDVPETLVRWCRRTGNPHAIVGGFFVRAGNAPLGELRIGGAEIEHVPFTAPWGAQRACVHAGPGGLAIARRPDLPARPRGDVLQAGPLLVRDGASAVTGDDDEGFTAGAHQFDSDISDGRHPRCALALTGGQLLALACDGRHPGDAGLTLAELADVLVGLGARTALNLDGGGSASLVCHGELVNRPREQHGIELLEGREIATALVFSAR
jgi:phosphodiester glycosidase